MPNPSKAYLFHPHDGCTVCPGLGCSELLLQLSQSSLTLGLGTRCQEAQAGLLHPTEEDGSQSTSVIFSLKDEKGALAKALRAFEVKYRYM